MMKKQSRIYSVTFGGNQTFIEAVDSRDARSYAVRCFGSISGSFRVTLASDEDVSWVRSMGGAIRKTESV